jgi:nickel-dependent lactate racemase
LKYDFFFKFYKDTSNKWKIEFIEVNDIANDSIIKYVSNEYWINLEQSNNNDNKLFVTNKSMKQILNYKRLVDLFNGKDQIIESTDKTRITKLEIFYDLINVILSEMKLDKKIYKYN